MEGRKSKRLSVEVGCWLVEMDGATCLYTFDLSDEGVAVVTEDPLPVGRSVTLQFFTPRSASAVTLKAQVVWSRLEPEGAMGLRFLDLDIRGRETLREFTRLLLELRERDRPGL